jgi:predicted heme/steroid binding protein
MARNRWLSQFLKLYKEKEMKFEVKKGPSGFWYLIGDGKVLDYSASKSWIDEQYCKFVGGLKEVNLAGHSSSR